jgi:hypothetical protein
LRDSKQPAGTRVAPHHSIRDIHAGDLGEPVVSDSQPDRTSRLFIKFDVAVWLTNIRAI